MKAGSVYIAQTNRELEEYTVVSFNEWGPRHLLKLSGVESREAAHELRGAQIYVDKEYLGEKQEGDFYHSELLGLGVYLDTGSYLGVLKGIFPTGSNDVYVVEAEKKEHLIPAIYEVIKEVNIPKGMMIISAMKGLLDL